MVDAPEFKIYSIFVSKLNCYGLDVWTITGKNWLAGELYPKDSNNPVPQGSIPGPVLFNSFVKDKKAAGVHCHRDWSWHYGQDQATCSRAQAPSRVTHTGWKNGATKMWWNSTRTNLNACSWKRRNPHQWQAAHSFVRTFKQFQLHEHSDLWIVSLHTNFYFNGTPCSYVQEWIFRGLHLVQDKRYFKKSEEECAFSNWCWDSQVLYNWEHLTHVKGTYTEHQSCLYECVRGFYFDRTLFFWWILNRSKYSK